ncbi:hypothetical protein SAMN04488483_5386 [Pseudomonas helmanticensis]|uniref:Uncharacterized protein n=1 Tax=Pseudomonas helmanticensis TaxID=1471381 RepID=A0ACD2UD47_9PSED|nr:hypothetical protein SAMN04488483_5386 [Pseudomonas helmanticensis]
MFDNTTHDCTDFDADRRSVPVHEYESVFLLPQMMMIHAMPSGVSWRKTTCHQLMHNSRLSYLFSRLRQALKRGIAH